MSNLITRLVSRALIKKKGPVKFIGNAYADLYCFFEGYNVIRGGSNIYNSYFGRASYIGENCVIHNTHIGKFVSIGQEVLTIFGQHPTRKFVSTHPAFFSTKAQAGFTFVKTTIFDDFLPKKENGFSVSIGNDVWIGSRVSILEGISIGDGAIIGAGSVVSKNVEPYTICIGNPLQVKRKRFSDEQVSILLQIKWWEKDFMWIKKHIEKFSNIDVFIEMCKGT